MLDSLEDPAIHLNLVMSKTKVIEAQKVLAPIKEMEKEMKDKFKGRGQLKHSRSLG